MNKTDIAKAAGIAFVGTISTSALLCLIVVRPVLAVILMLACLTSWLMWTIAEDLAATRKRKAKGEISLEHLTSAEWSELANEKSVAISQNGKKYIIIIPASIDIELDNYTTNDLIITEIRK